MAVLKSANKTKNTSVPVQKADPAELKGKSHTLYDSYTFSANVFALNDEIELADLPEGALILGAKIKSPSLGTTGIFELGLRAHELADGSQVAEDSDYLVDAADAGGQGVFAEMGDDPANLEPGFGKKLGKAATPYLLCTEATDAANGLKLEVVIEYALP